MISVELQRVPEGERDYRAVATMTVADDGTYRFEDPESLFPTSAQVLAPDVEGQLRPVTLEEDPQAWARNLAGLLRTGYLVPVVVRDDAAASS